jgi:hypothetical protein
MPAQFTATFKPPMSLCACAIAAVKAASFVTSTFWKRAGLFQTVSVLG